MRPFDEPFPPPHHDTMAISALTPNAVIKLNERVSFQSRVNVLLKPHLAAMRTRPGKDVKTVRSAPASDQLHLPALEELGRRLEY